MKLGDVAYYVTKRVSADKVTKDTYISTENMRPNKDGFMPSDELPPYPSYTSYDEHDILISNIRPYFKKILYAKANGGCSNDVLVLRAKDPDNYSSSFLYYALSQDYFFNFMMAGAKGTKMPRGNKKSILDFELPEYNLAKQERIATILSHYDDLIEINKRRIALLEESARELYKEWFVRMRFPGWETSEFVNGVPNDWDEKEFSSIIDICSSKRIFQSEYVSNGVPFYRGQEITQLANNELIDNVLYISKERYDQIRKSNDVPQEGDILLTAVGTIGNSFMVDNREFYFKDGNIIWLKTRNSNLKYYLYSLLNTSYFRELINNTCIGSSQKALTIDMVGKIKIVVPSESVIKKFSQLYEVFHSAKNILIKEIYKLSLQRDRLLPRLMSGQLEV